MKTLNRGRLKLIYIKPILKESGSKYEYDFLFSEDPDVAWGPDWDYPSPSTCEDTSPEPSTYSTVMKVKTDLPLKTAQENGCYSMEYAVNGSIALGWVDIEGLEEYPENGRMVFHFGDAFNSVEAQLESHDIEWKPAE